MPDPIEAAWIDRSDRSRLEVRGPDRAKMLHNLTTNDVKRLAVGRGCEAFVTSPQGKTLGYVSLLADADRIWLRTDSGALGPILAHLQKYGAFDDATWDDRTASTFELHVAGPRAAALLDPPADPGPPGDDLAHVAATIGDRPVLVVREAPAGLPGLTLIGDRADLETVLDAIRRRGEGLGLVALGPLEFEAFRIEAGTPVAGRDVTADNLPQEVGRDARAINFVKGCYLGQETVARLDALGHVNKVLAGARVEGSDILPPPGTALEVDGKKVGEVTSSAYSPGLDCAILLGYIRIPQAVAGTELTLALDGRPIAVVADLPMGAPKG